MRAGPPCDESRIRRASPMGSATLTAAASAAMIGAAVRQPMVAPEAAVDRAFPAVDAFGITERSVSSRVAGAEVDWGALRDSRAASAVERRRRPASSQEEGGESHNGSVDPPGEPRRGWARRRGWRGAGWMRGLPKAGGRCYRRGAPPQMWRYERKSSGLQ